MLFRIIAVLLSVLLSTTFANAACIVDQTDVNSSRTVSPSYGQSITAACDGVIDTITVYTHGDTGTGIPAATIEIYENSAGSVGSPIFSESHPESLREASGTGLTGHIYLLTDGPAVTSGSTYSIMFNTSGQGWSPMGNTDGNSYTGGTFITSDTSVDTSYDMLFSVNISDPTEIEFGDNSAKFTNQYLPLKVGYRTLEYGYGDYNGRVRYIDVIGEEVVDGINCLKFNKFITNKETDYYVMWMAQDTQGNVWIIQIYNFENDQLITFGQDNAVLFIPGDPTIGQIVLDFGDSYGEILATDATVPTMQTGLGPFTNCLKVKEYYGGGDIDYYYYAPNFGSVWNPHEDTPEQDPRGYELQKTIYIPPGDSNIDGKVGMEDAINILKMAVGK